MWNVCGAVDQKPRKYAGNLSQQTLAKLPCRQESGLADLYFIKKLRCRQCDGRDKAAITGISVCQHQL
jgi:hypothetical protein